MVARTLRSLENVPFMLQLPVPAKPASLPADAFEQRGHRWLTELHAQQLRLAPASPAGSLSASKTPILERCSLLMMLGPS